MTWNETVLLSAAQAVPAIVVVVRRLRTFAPVASAESRPMGQPEGSPRHARRRDCNLWPPPKVIEGMRNECLRDVIAGSAGVLLVLALIGLPKDHPAPIRHVQVQVQWRGVRLLPYYTPNLVPARPTP